MTSLRASPTAACVVREVTSPGDSPYRLPFAIGSTLVMFQGNCPPNPAWSQHGKYAYDFRMPIGTPIHALRGGTVANYLNMTQSSVVATVGAAVAAGDLVGFSGNGGASDRPHLHVEAYTALPPPPSAPGSAR